MTVSNITMGEGTPTQQIVADAVTEATVVDTAGRTFTLKKPGVLAQFKMIEMLGGETAQNSVFVFMVFPMLYVVAIDGEVVSRPTTRRELDALIQRLDEHGIAAVTEGVSKNFGSAPVADKDAAIKN